MSSRRSAAGPLPQNIQDVIGIIEQAKAANSAWGAANESSLPVDAPSTWLQSGQELWNPWELTFSQSLMAAGAYGGVKVKHDLTLSGGSYGRLRGMVNALTAGVEPVYASNDWTVSQPGDVYKVCKYPDKSTGGWGFTKVLQGSELEIAEDATRWIIPGGFTNPERALRAIFKASETGEIKAVLDDVAYVITPTGTAKPGKSSAFQIKRAYMLKDQ
jgi:hypothetical protein